MILGAFGLPFGLFMTILSGAELFTGNTALVTMAYLNDKASKEQLAKSWGYSYAGNFVGSVALAALVVAGGTLSASAAPAAIAAAKTSMAFKTALIRGVLCNWLVCMAVYLASHARDVGGKMVAIWFPISAFVAMGLEHSVANMFLVPLAIMQVRPDCGARALTSATSRRHSAPSAHAAPACTPRSAAPAGRDRHVGHLPHEESLPRHAWQHHRRRRRRRARLHPRVQGVIRRRSPRARWSNAAAYIDACCLFMAPAAARETTHRRRPRSETAGARRRSTPPAAFHAAQECYYSSGGTTWPCARGRVAPAGLASRYLYNLLLQ